MTLLDAVEVLSNHGIDAGKYIDGERIMRLYVDCPKPEQHEKIKEIQDILGEEFVVFVFGSLHSIWIEKRRMNPFKKMEKIY